MSHRSWPSATIDGIGHHREEDTQVLPLPAVEIPIRAAVPLPELFSKVYSLFVSTSGESLYRFNQR